MKVDLTSLIIGICALASFAVPIAWYQISEKMKEKKLHSDINQYAQEENITLTSEEVWGDHYALGVDKKSRKLVYLKHTENGDQKELIDLSKVQKCKVSNGTKTIRDASGKKSVITSINLLFHYLDSGKGASSLEVYDDANGRTLTYEISIANKLARTIRPLLKTTSNGYKLPTY